MWRSHTNSNGNRHAKPLCDGDAEFYTYGDPDTLIGWMS
jgi:hypothetical protein